MGVAPTNVGQEESSFCGLRFPFCLITAVSLSSLCSAVWQDHICYLSRDEAIGIIGSRAANEPWPRKLSVTSVHQCIWRRDFDRIQVMCLCWVLT
jgi:hypothetical protein